MNRDSERFTELNSRMVWPLMWAVLLLAMAEFLLEYRAASRGFTTHLFGQPKATQLAAEDPSQEVYGPSANFPFRSRLVKFEKSPRTMRIWLASSSHAEDVRMPVSDLFVSVLETQLRQQGIPCEVLNASRAGMTLEQNTEQLKALAKKWKPDVVICYQMTNDLAAAFHNADSEQSVPQGLPIFPQYMDRFVEQTTLFEQIKSNVTSRINHSKILRGEDPAGSQQRYFEQLEELRESSVEEGAKFLVCTFGFSHPGGKLPTDYELVLLKTIPDLRPSAWSKVIDSWNGGIRERYPDQTLDIAETVNGQHRLFRDPVHFTKEGHEVIGKKMASELIRLGVFDRNRVAKKQ